VSAVTDARRYLNWVQKAWEDTQEEIKSIIHGAPGRYFQITSNEYTQIEALGQRSAAIDIQIAIARKRLKTAESEERKGFCA
jgi:hypothetical protein